MGGTRASPSRRTPRCGHFSSREKVRLLIDAGVDSIVDLTTPPDHLASYRDALEFVATQAGHQIHHFAHPIPDMSVIGPRRVRRNPCAHSRPKSAVAEWYTSTAGAVKGACAPWSDASSLTMGLAQGGRDRAHRTVEGGHLQGRRRLSGVPVATPVVAGARGTADSPPVDGSLLPFEGSQMFTSRSSRCLRRTALTRT